MRGWLHFWSFAASIAACATLIAVSAALVGGMAALAASVYSVTTLGLFGTSALYHRRNWATDRGRVIMRRLDHSMIFLFIAGTYTPVAALAMEPATTRWVLIVVWAGALAGVVLKMLWPHAPAWVGVPIYIALGWVAVFNLPDFARTGGTAVVVLVIVGGLLYTAGAVVYGLKRPDPSPAWFGFHEVFHALTIAAFTAHYTAILLAAT
jgi:hemolysin III